MAKKNTVKLLNLCELNTMKQNTYKWYSKSRPNLFANSQCYFSSHKFLESKWIKAMPLQLWIMSKPS